MRHLHVVLNATSMTYVRPYVGVVRSHSAIKSKHAHDMTGWCVGNIYLHATAEHPSHSILWSLILPRKPVEYGNAKFCTSVAILHNSVSNGSHVALSQNLLSFFVFISSYGAVDTSHQISPTLVQLSVINNALSYQVFPSKELYFSVKVRWLDRSIHLVERIHCQLQHA